MFQTGCMFWVFSLLNSLLDFHVFGCSNDKCSDKPKFTTSSLVVKYGDPASATCVACQSICIGEIFDLEKNLGDTVKEGTRLSWTAANVTEWIVHVQCYYTTSDNQCCTKLPITVYQPPEDVSISVVNHSGPMSESGQYTLQCDVQNAAPLRNLIVTFYKGQTELGQLKSTSTTKRPASENFTLDFTTSKEDNGIQFWCEAKLQLVPDGPQTPPVVTSRKLNATVYYGPYLMVSADPDAIKIKFGETLQLNCSAEGNPAPSFKWTLPSGHSFFNDSVLTIKSVDFGQAGQYICTVDNNVKSVQVNFTVDVQANYNPYIIVLIILSVLLVLTGILTFYPHDYNHKRVGKKNLKVKSSKSQHTAVPLGEDININLDGESELGTLTSAAENNT